MFIHYLATAAMCAMFGVSSAYEGDGTFYGAGGNGAAGACMLQPGFNGVGVTVAMNAAQFDGACGRCVRLTGGGNGAGGTPIFGPLYATVDNECPECQFGDVDLGLSGDGRWRIQWDYVDCGEARGAGSNVPGWHGRNRQLRGTEGKPEGFLLEPGYMITTDGVKLIADVVAQQKAVNTTVDAGN